MHERTWVLSFIISVLHACVDVCMLLNNHMCPLDPFTDNRSYISCFANIADALKHYGSWSRIQFTFRRRGGGVNLTLDQDFLVCGTRPVRESELWSVLLQVFVVCGDRHKLGKKKIQFNRDLMLLCQVSRHWILVCVCALLYLILVCGVKFIPRLWVIGLVPAKHTNRYTDDGDKSASRETL